MRKWKLAALSLLACLGRPVSAQQLQYADLILRGGKVITVDGQDRLTGSRRGGRKSHHGNRHKSGNLAAWPARKPGSSS